MTSPRQEAHAWLTERNQQFAAGELKDTELDGVAGGIVIIGSRGDRSEASRSNSQTASPDGIPAAPKVGWDLNANKKV